MSQGPENHKPEYRFAQHWFTTGEEPKRARLRSEGGESTWKKATNDPEDPIHDCANTKGDTPHENAKQWRRPHVQMTLHWQQGIDF